MIDWNSVVENKGYVLHRPTGIVAQAVRFYPPGEYHSGGNEEEPVIEESVIGLADGNAFLSESGDLLVMDEQDVRAYRSFQQALGEIIKVAAQQLTRDEKQVERSIEIVVSGIRAQLHAFSSEG